VVDGSTVGIAVGGARVAVGVGVAVAPGSAVDEAAGAVGGALVEIWGARTQGVVAAAAGFGMADVADGIGVVVAIGVAFAAAPD